MGFEIVYKKDTGQILLSRRAAAPADDLAPGEGEDKVFLSLDLENRPMTAFRVDPEQGTLELREDYVEPERGVELSLTSDAADMSPIDGIPAIPADGRSTTALTVQKKVVATGHPLTGAKHKNLLNIRTTAGTLSAPQLNLEKGRTTFTLRSSTETVVAEVRVWATEIPRPAIIRIEFAPVP
jgi:hypothetical protein